MDEKQKSSDFNNWIFGCDICEDVCPWNRFARPHEAWSFDTTATMKMSTEEWVEMAKEVFEKVFAGSAVKRTGFEGIKRNIKFIVD